MKKFLVFILILVCFCAISLFKTQTNPLLACENVEKVCFVSSGNIEDMESVKCGDMVFNYCTLKQANEKLSKIESDLKGVEFYIKDISFEKLCEILKVEVVSQSQVGDLNVFCCYSPYGQENVTIDGKKVNVQIAVYDDLVLAGFPMLLTGF